MLRSALVCLLVWPALIFAQPPNIKPVFPCGVQRGITTEITFTGENVHEPLGLLCSFPVKATFLEPLNDPSKIKARLEVPSDAPLGWHTVRLHTRRGISNMQIFCIDDLPQTLVTGSPNTIQKPMDIKLPTVVCGTIAPGQRHYFRFKLLAEQTLNAEILARRMGSPLDPALVLYEEASTAQLDFSDDSPGLQKDAQFAYQSNKDRVCILEVRDGHLGGGGDHHYRLRLGRFAQPTVAYPMAIKRGTKGHVPFHFERDKLGGLDVEVTTSKSVVAMSVTPRLADIKDQQAGWPLPVLLSDYAETTLTRNLGIPLDHPDVKQLISAPLDVPMGITANFDHKGDKHRYLLKLQPGVRYRMEALTAELGSPAQVSLTLTDSKGKKLASSNPELDVTQIEFTPPPSLTPPSKGGEPIEYHLTAEHLYFASGPEQCYRVSVVPVKPSFTLTANTDRFDVPCGNRAVVIMQANRSGGYQGPIELKVTSPAELQGTATIPAGKNEALMAISAKIDAPIKCDSVVITGTPLEKEVAGEIVRIGETLRQAMHGLKYPPLTLNTLPGCGLQSPVPFKLTAEFVGGHPMRGMPVQVRFKVDRQPGFTVEVSIQSIHLPTSPVLAPITAKIPANDVQAIGTFKPDANAVDGMLYYFIAKATVEGREIIYTSEVKEMKYGPAPAVSKPATPSK